MNVQPEKEDQRWDNATNNFKGEARFWGKKIKPEDSVYVYIYIIFLVVWVCVCLRFAKRENGSV